MEPTFDDKAQEVIETLENSENVAAMIFSAHDGEGELLAISGVQPAVGDNDPTSLLGALLIRISEMTELHPEDVANEAIKKARDIDESGSISW